MVSRFWLSVSLVASTCSLLSAQTGASARNVTHDGTDGLRTPVQTVTPKPILTPEARGDIYMARKNYREAILAYQENAAGNATILNKLGMAYIQMLDLQTAKKYYESAIKANPNYAEAVNNLGAVYFAQKSYRRAVNQYKRAIRLEPGAASMYSNLGSAYFQRKDYKRANEAYQEAVARDPDVFEHHGSNGVLLQENSVEDRAKYHYFMAKMYAKSGANERALQNLRKALEEGWKDRNKINDEPEFAVLRTTTEFKELLAAQPHVL